MTQASLRKPLFGVAFVTAGLLLIPATAMRFTSEVAWGPGDFIVAGILLFGAGALAVLVFRHVSGFRRRAALIGVIGLGLALVWAELAVGLFS